MPGPSVGAAVGTSEGTNVGVKVGAVGVRVVGAVGPLGTNVGALLGTRVVGRRVGGLVVVVIAIVVKTFATYKALP
jgi:hypothetical protein